MKVKITHTLDLNEVPQKVNDLIKPAVDGTLAVMKGDKEYEKFLLASAFGALKVQKEEAKFMIMDEEL